ncbi:hypothetical protein [Bradyrhizobium sp. USDA 4486]
MRTISMNLGHVTTMHGTLRSDEEMAFRLDTLLGEQRIMRLSCGKANPWHDFQWRANAYLEGSLKLDECVTTSIALAVVNPGLARLAAGEDIRVMIEP